MFAIFPFHCQPTLRPAMLLLFGLLFWPLTVYANGPYSGSTTHWTVMACSGPESQVQLLHDSRKIYEQDRPTFVITHGMGGTTTDDRFLHLADAIGDAIAECSVLIVDWSKQSRHTGWFGLPNPFAVAAKIDSVALEASSLLKAIKMEPHRTTFVGESFGNCVNAQVDKTLGGQGRILAFNPANEAGGYTTPDLTACSDRA